VALARRGCSIAVHYNSSADKAHALVEELQKSFRIRAVAFGADLSNYDNVRKLHAEVVEKLGHPDILFNNAGDTVKVIGRMGNIDDISVDLFEKTWKLNTGSQFLVSHFYATTYYPRMMFDVNMALDTYLDTCN
jgi:3-oxoacyl-[acyl-carrier protein] reductase